jgi:hypothetical protein
MDGTYYLVRKQQLMRDFNQEMKCAAQVLAVRYGPNVVDSIIQQTRQEFEALLFHLPYIGGEENPMTDNLVQSAWYLAIYRVLISYGKTAEEAGEVCYLMTEQALCNASKLLMRISGKIKFNRITLGQLQQHAARSQQREYPGDWVYEYVDGDGQTFDYGVNYTECGICKFFHAQGADEFSSYVCLLDYPASQASGTGMRRTTTLAEGASMCDLRFKDGREVQGAWPPQFAAHAHARAQE